jgi:trehalose-6-phosphatase
MQLIIDIDGTICSEERQFSRPMATPKDNAIEAIAKLKSQGHIVILYSSRTWAEYEMTVDWLKRHGVEYDQLILGKPVGDYWIDDRAIEFTSWNDVLERIDQ